MRLAIVVSALLALSLALQKQKSDSNKNVPAADQRGTPHSPLVIRLDSAQHRADADDHEKELKERGEADKTLANYTLYLAGIALLQLMVFGYQAAKLRATVTRMEAAEALTSKSVDEMRRAADAAGDSAKAAHISADVARASVESYAAAERAWVSLHSIVTTGFSDATDVATGTTGHAGVLFGPQWTNGGRTPAVQCALGTRVMAIRLPFVGEKPPHFTIDEEPHRTRTTLVTGVTVSAEPANLSADVMSMLRNRECTVFLYCRADYRDVFSDLPRYFEAAMEVEFRGIDDSTKTELFGYRLVGSQNGAG